MRPDISEAFVEDIALFARSDDQPDYLRRFGQRFGLSEIAYIRLKPLSATTPPIELLTTCLKAWEDRYVEKGYDASDPVVSSSFLGILPFDWGTVPKSDKSAIDFLVKRPNSVSAHRAFPYRSEPPMAARRSSQPVLGSR